MAGARVLRGGASRDHPLAPHLRRPGERKREIFIFTHKYKNII